MLTPYFSVSQDDEYILISVKVSHIRFSAKSIEMVVDDNVFIFSLAPYYLRLRFPYSVVDDERAKADFNSQNSSVDIKLPKETKGQFFPDLDLSAKLLARKEDVTPQAPAKPLIEDLDVRSTILDETQNPATANSVDGGQSLDWEIQQEVAPEQESTPCYGFNNSYSNIVGVSTTSGNDINELGDPESPLPNDRIIERLIKENIKFDPEYYAADYIMQKHPSADDDKDYSGLMSWKSPTTRQFLSWYKKQQQFPDSEREAIMPVEFSKEEQEKMLQLPRKSYLIEDHHKPQLLALLLSLLFAYQYDLRENEGEHNIESAWTIGKLVPQFSFLDAQLMVPHENSPSIWKACVITGIRRSLCYPYYRHYSLAKKAWDDVYYCLRGGKRVVLKCLMDLRELFRYHDVYYVYDKIWLEDMCSWLITDQVTENHIRHLAHDFKRELDSVAKTDITFEKVDDTQNGDAMIVLDVHEVELMAEDSYSAYMDQS